MGSKSRSSVRFARSKLTSRMTGLDLFHVPYRGAQVFPTLLAGDAQIYFGPLLSSIEYIRAGKLRALAVTTTTRSDACQRFRR
jgi:tripartite-type tricarboxylate transporter receptor subunit TctC